MMARARANSNDSTGEEAMMASILSYQHVREFSYYMRARVANDKKTFADEKKQNQPLHQNHLFNIELAKDQPRQRYTLEEYLDLFYSLDRLLFNYQMILALMLYYIDTYCQNTGDYIQDNNVYRLLLTSLTVAQKMIIDVAYNNKTLASLGKISLSDLNKMEKAFCGALNYNMIPPAEKVYQYCGLFSQPLTPPLNPASTVELKDAVQYEHTQLEKIQKNMKNNRKMCVIL